MRIVLVSGATGLVGSALMPALRSNAYRCKRLLRGGHAGADDIHWSPYSGSLDSDLLKGVDAVVHLAGESIAGRWSPGKKEAIRESRVRGTQVLAEALARMETPPSVLVCASAIGFYGDRGDEVLTEASPPGSDFLAEVCKEWETATEPAAKGNNNKIIRTVLLRFGVILSARGGALKQMLPPFKLGVGGILGSGRQYWSWITLDDVIGAIEHALTTPTLSGPVNVVAPVAATNREFTTALGRALHRPTIFPVPAFAARLLLGEMADALLLASTRVKPEKLEASGFKFKYPELSSALAHVLEREKVPLMC